MKLDVRGFSLVEVLVASLLISVVAAGTMASFIASARITQDENASTMTEAGGRSLQTLESLRNSVTATGTTFSGASGGWTSVAPGGGGGGTAGGNDTRASTLSVSSQNATSQYRVIPQDCDGDGNTGDCYTVSVRQCWDGSPCN